MHLWKPSPDPSQCGARPRWGHVVLVLALLVQAIAVVSYVGFFTQPSPGFAVVHVDPAQNVFLAIPLTTPAANGSTGSEIVGVRRINGRSPLDVPEGTAYSVALREGMDLTPGGANTFTLPRDDRLVTLRVPVAKPELAIWFANAEAYYQLLAWLYLACGAFVWWRRPTDRAALPLLVFTSVASVQLTVPAALVWMSHPLDLVRMAILPLYAAAGLWLTLAFTGFHVRQSARIAQRAVSAVSLCLAMTMLGSGAMANRAHVAYASIREFAEGATGVTLVATIVVMLAFCWEAARPPHPLGLRRRARVIAKAIAVAFLIPSLYLATNHFLPKEAHAPMSLVVLVLMATYPLMLVYAIVRHQMFDLRIVLRQGVVYGALSLLVTLSYLGVVLATVKVLGRHAESPVVIAIAAGALVLLASLLKLKVQSAVDRLVFRARYVYADAVATASEALRRARSIDAITETVRSALIDAMQLSRAYFAVRDRDHDTLRCFVLGNKPEAEDGRLPPELPAELNPEEIAPIKRAIAARSVATAFDSSAASAQTAAVRTRAAGSIPDEYGEGTFWAHFGIEAICPLTIGDANESEHVIGLLILGPKLSERQLDPEDQRLLTTLANQLAVALENAHAFEEIERLKEHLEEQVERRTQELRDALEHLSQAQSRLVESQKQAMLGRLVAGIVHEVNSPLGALSSSADTIRRSLERARGYVQDGAVEDAARVLRALDTGEELTAVIRSGSSRIGSLMTSLSSFISLDQAEYKSFDLRQGVESALTLLRPLLGDGVELEVQLPNEPITVRGGPAKLNQVFLSLLENAVVAVRGRGRLRVGIAGCADHVEVVIEDDGCGIAPEDLEHLFDFRFTTKAGGRIGLGLGLPTSKRTVEELGGTLTIQSQLGQGTTVRVVLPSAKPVSQLPPAPN